MNGIKKKSEKYDDLDLTYLDELSPQKAASATTASEPMSFLSSVANSKPSEEDFRRYLDQVKRSYFGKLANSCPPKVTQPSRFAAQQQPENLSNLLKLVNTNNESSPSSVVRRSLNYDSQPMLFQLAKNQAVVEPSDITSFIHMPELTKTQILSRLVQIRDYLKQAYSMLANVQEATDMPNRMNKIDKLNSLIDHMKDQEKGYLELMNSFSKFQQLTSNFYSKAAALSGDKAIKDNSFEIKQENNQSQTDAEDTYSRQMHSNYFKSNSSASQNQKQNKQQDDSSASCSIAGSFISDTITLNGGGDNLQQQQQSRLMKNLAGGKLTGETCFEDEEQRTENDQDEDDEELFGESEFDEQSPATNRKDGAENRDGQLEQRRELLKALNGDISALDQLREQKKLLRSLRLKKEEMKALEGRRKALEALKKLNAAGSTGASSKTLSDDLLTDSGITTSTVEDERKLREFESFLNMLKEKQAQKSVSEANINTSMSNYTRSSMANSLSKPEISSNTTTTTINKSASGAPMVRKTFSKQSIQQSPQRNTNISEDEAANNKRAASIEQEIIQKRLLNDSKSLLRPMIKSEAVGDRSEQTSDYFSASIAAAVNSRKEDYDDDDDDEGVAKYEDREELKSELKTKLMNLAENEKKLQELYSLQQRLAGLKKIMSDFNLMSDDQKRQEERLEEAINRQTNDYIGVAEQKSPSKVSNAFDEAKMLMERSQARSTINNNDDDEEDEPINSYAENYRRSLEIGAANKKKEYGDDNDENLDLEEEKRKLANAKEKLKDLQDFIEKLEKLARSSNGSSVGRYETKKRSSNDDEEEGEDDEEEEEEEVEEEENEYEREERLEREKKANRLSELERNKQHLLELLRQKEIELSNLAKLTSSTTPQQQQSPERSKLNSQSMVTSDFGEIESKFKSAEDDFDCLLSVNGDDEALNGAGAGLRAALNIKQLSPSSLAKIQKTAAASHHSPSDLLWNQMKRQLNMRESMRSKKKELEDLIRDEYQNAPFAATNNSTTDNRNRRANLDEEDDEEGKRKSYNNEEETENSDESSETSSSSDESEANKNDDDDEDEDNNNEIINGYRHFFLRKKSKKQQEEEDAEETAAANESLSSKRNASKQGNLTSADEIVKTSTTTTTTAQQSSTSTTQQQQSEHSSCNQRRRRLWDSTTDEFESRSGPTMTTTTTATSLSDRGLLVEFTQRLDDLFEGQRKMSECIQRGFGEISERLQFQKSSSISPVELNANSAGSAASMMLTANSHIQLQLQVQQLMIQLNSAFSEIASQRSEISKLNELIRKMNGHQETEATTAPRYHKMTSTCPTSTSTVGVCTTSEETANEAQTAYMNLHAYHPLHHTQHRHYQALPSYFYNSSKRRNTQQQQQIQKQMSTASSQRQETHYVDDFEDEDEEEEEEKKTKLCFNKRSSDSRKRGGSFSSTASSVSSSGAPQPTAAANTNADSSSDDSSTVSKNTNSTFSIDSSTLALRQNLKPKNIMAPNTSPTTAISAAAASVFGRSKESSSKFEQMREQIYSEVAALITQNESRPVYLLSLFKELQLLRDKNARDQCLKSIFNISTRRPSTTTTSEHDDNDDVIFTKTSCSSHRANDEDLIEQSYLKSNDGSGVGGCGRTSASSATNHFECDSLSNTVIFVNKNAATINSQTSPDKKNLNSIGTNTDATSTDTSSFFANNDERIVSENIGSEVKQLISKIITQIRFSPDGSFEDSSGAENETPTPTTTTKTPIASTSTSTTRTAKAETFDEDGIRRLAASSSSASLRTVKFDSDYMNEIVDKVLNVLRQSSKHYDYLRLYQGQLNVYLRESLMKYENRRLVDCIEDILIDISDILYNELTFYSIMSTKGVCTNKYKKLDSSSSTSSLNTDGEESDAIERLQRELIKEAQHQYESENIELDTAKYKGIELLKKLNMLINDKLAGRESETSEDEEAVNKVKAANLGSSSVSFSDEDGDDEEDENEKNEDLEQGEIKEDEQDDEDDKDATNFESFKTAVDENNDDEDEIKLEDLPPRLNLEGLSEIIAESINDNLVGDSEALNLPQMNNPEESELKPPEADNLAVEKTTTTTTMCENEPKSDRSSSGSDQYVIVSSGGAGSSRCDGTSGSESESVEVKVEVAASSSEKTSSPEVVVVDESTPHNDEDIQPEKKEENGSVQEEAAEATNNQ